MTTNRTHQVMTTNLTDTVEGIRSYRVATSERIDGVRSGRVITWDLKVAGKAQTWVTIYVNGSVHTLQTRNAAMTAQLVANQVQVNG